MPSQTRLHRFCHKPCVNRATNSAGWLSCCGPSVQVRAFEESQNLAVTIMGVHGRLFRFKSYPFGGPWRVVLAYARDGNGLSSPVRRFLGVVR